MGQYDREHERSQIEGLDEAADILRAEADRYR